MKEETIADRVRAARKKRGLTMMAVEAAMGVKHGYLSRLESGQRTSPQADSILAIARALDVSTDWLLTGLGRGPHSEDELSDHLKEAGRAVNAPTWLLRQAAHFSEVHGDLPVALWRDYLDGLRREARRMELELVAKT